MPTTIPVAGEKKWVDEAVLMNKKDRGDWRRCDCCGDYFSVKASRIPRSNQESGEEILKRRYAYDAEAWELRMPVHENKSFQKKVYCSRYCKRFWHETKAAQKRGSQVAELLKADYIDRLQVVEIIDDLQLEVDTDKLRGERPDAKYIDIEETLIHKFQKGIWRVCSNPRCPDPDRIFYAEHRKWFVRDRQQPSPTAMYGKTVPYPLVDQDGERLIGYVKLTYIPELVRRSRMCCSATCRKGLERWQNKQYEISV